MVVSHTRESGEISLDHTACGVMESAGVTVVQTSTNTVSVVSCKRLACMDMIGSLSEAIMSAHCEIGHGRTTPATTAAAATALGCRVSRNATQHLPRQVLRIEVVGSTVMRDSTSLGKLYTYRVKGRN